MLLFNNSQLRIGARALQNLMWLVSADFLLYLFIAKLIIDDIVDYNSLDRDINSHFSEFTGVHCNIF